LNADHAQTARVLDEADPLCAFRERFALPRDATGQPLTYLCGHSLGLMPLAARDAVVQELDDWARLGVRGHEHARRPWIPYHEALAAPLARLAGASPAEVIAMGSLSVNLHLLLASFYRPYGRRSKILIEEGAFASDRHVVTSQITWHGLDPATALIELAPRPQEALVSHEAIESCLAAHGEEIALVLWPGVQYRTGQAFDLGRIAASCHRHGCIAGFDLAHSIGNLPLSLHEDTADFAAWCSYKYLNAGPGATAGAFIHERHAGRPHLSGWWGVHESARFQMAPDLVPAPGAAGWQISNPPILSTAPLLASLALFEEAGMARLRTKSVALTGFLAALLQELAPAVEIITPAAAGERGCQLSLRIVGASGQGRRVFEHLSAAGVVCDWREPDIIRVAPVPLYNRFADVARLQEALAEALLETQA
jgi:kynureninase